MSRGFFPIMSRKIFIIYYKLLKHIGCKINERDINSVIILMSLIALVSA